MKIVSCNFFSHPNSRIPWNLYMDSRLRTAGLTCASCEVGFSLFKHSVKNRPFVFTQYSVVVCVVWTTEVKLHYFFRIYIFFSSFLLSGLQSKLWEHRNVQFRLFSSSNYLTATRPTPYSVCATFSIVSSLPSVSKASGFRSLETAPRYSLHLVRK
jgi:hypothetical protein